MHVIIEIVDPFTVNIFNMLKDELQKLGMDAKEASVYLAALELAEGTLQEISRKSRVKRTTAYDVIESLKRRGLITVSRRGGRAIYVAEDPRNIGHDLDEKRTVLDRIMPELLSAANLFKQKPGIRYFEEIEGLREAYKDILAYPGQEICSWWPADYSFFDKRWFYDYFMPKRIERKIWARVIAPDNAFIRKIAAEDAASLRHTHLFPPGNLPFEVEIDLYARKTLILSFQEKIAVVIESQKIHDTLKSIFEISWMSPSHEK